MQCGPLQARHSPYRHDKAILDYMLRSTAEVRSILKRDIESESRVVILDVRSLPKTRRFDHTSSQLREVARTGCSSLTRHRDQDKPYKTTISANPIDAAHRSRLPSRKSSQAGFYMAL